jgi:choline monooxygenase
VRSVLSAYRHFPSSAYTSADVLQQEKERVFSPGWAWAGFVHWLPGRGSSVPAAVAGMPLVLTRDLDDEVRVFHNVCRHRGLQLCEVASTGPLRCPYHAWTYGLDGRLQGAPYWDRSKGSAPDPATADELGLVRVRSATWAGMIFVNITGQAEPLEAALAPLRERLAALDLSRLSVCGERRFEVAANWKLPIENFLDSYHLPWVHPEIGPPSVSFAVHDVVVSDDILGTRYPTGSAGKERKTGRPLPLFGPVPPGEQSWQELFWLAPNLLLMAQADHFWVIGVEPTGPEKTVEHLAVFVDRDAEGPEFARERRQLCEVLFKINEQDLPILARLQAGRHSPASDHNVFAPHWDGIGGRFHERISELLSGGRTIGHGIVGS